MELSWEYIAGFFDGEGHVAIPVGSLSRSPRCGALRRNIQVSQSGHRGYVILSEIRMFLDAQGIRTCLRETKARGNRQVSWMLSVDHRESGLKFLQRTLPYLRVKKLEAQDVYRFVKLYPSLSTNLGRKPYAKY